MKANLPPDESRQIVTYFGLKVSQPALKPAEIAVCLECFPEPVSSLLIPPHAFKTVA